MKRGCFYSSVFVLTILVGIIVYFVKYKSDFYKPLVTKFASDITMREVEKRIKNVRQSEGKDSLLCIIELYKKSIIKEGRLNTEEIGSFVDKVNEITLHDSVSTEGLGELQKFIK